MLPFVTGCFCHRKSGTHTTVNKTNNNLDVLMHMHIYTALLFTFTFTFTAAGECVRGNGIGALPAWVWPDVDLCLVVFRRQ